MEQHIEQKQTDISRFLDGEGRVTSLPKKHAPRAAVLGYLAEAFETKRDYTEREVNGILDGRHTFGDFFLLRRELVEAGLLCRTRNGARYWKPEPDGDKEE